MLGSLDGALKINCFYNDITGGINFLFLHYIFEESDFNHPQNIQVTKNETSLLILHQFSQLTHLVLPLALGALDPQHKLFGGLGLLPQDGFGLAAEALLLAVVPGIAKSDCGREGRPWQL